MLCGWAWHNRDHGGLIFVDLRDRAGYTQVVVDPDCVSADDFAKAEHLGREYVLKIAGTVRERGAEAVNPNMATGEIEVLAKSVEVLNTSVTPPFSIEDGIETDETTRMKWRYLDIRRPEMYEALHLRHTVAQAMRGALNERGFLEVETPILANSTPEGARDYIVPSRPNPGRFYALPQSPQQFKQMLMVAGIERYYQIARCFRDEDLRADRQPEFTQVDIEMSFVHGDDVIDMMEGVMAEVLEAVGVEHEFPLQRMQYSEAMERFGNDRPDTRFGMELHDITDIVKDTGFKVFSSVAQSGGVVKAINAKGAGDWSRGDVEKLADIAAENGAKGMAWIAFTTDGKEKSPIIKFFSDEEFAALKEAMDVEPCVFAHYANANIRETTLLDALKSPIFMQYYERQPFNDNLLRPCPILENRDVLADMVETAGAHSTDLQAKESARDLCAKCTRSIEEWEPVAERIWTNAADPLFDKRHDPGQGMAETDKNKFDRLNRQRKPLEDKAQTGEPAA